MILLLLTFCGPLWAHAKLLVGSDIPPRYDNPGIKGSDPCGSESGTKTNIISSYPRGATVKVEWIETIDHYGYFQVDFSTDGGSTFINPVQVDDPVGSSIHQFAINYTLPDQLCGAAGCLLRMRQYMQSSNTFYYSCADVALTAPDTTPQQAASALSITDSVTSLDLSWMNPAQSKGVLVLRDTQDQFGSLVLSNLTVYHVGDSFNGAEILFKSENGAGQFSDTQFYGNNDYYYAVYMYSDSYIYSSPLVSSIHTAFGSGLGYVPEAATALSINATTTNIDLTWTNPAQLKGVLVLRASQDQFTGLALNDLSVYQVGDNINGAAVVFKSENNDSQFSDTLFYGDSDYYYAVFVYSDIYLYSTPVVSSVHTASGSGLDYVQEAVTALTINDTMTNVDLTWTNPAQLKGVLVLRASQDQFSGLALNDLSIYQVGDTINGAEVVFKSEINASQFSDTQFYGDSDYYYAVFAYSDNYLYSSSALANVHTASGSGLGNMPVSPPPSNNNSNSEDSGGAFDPIFLALLALLANLAIFREVRRQALVRVRAKRQK